MGVARALQSKTFYIIFAAVDVFVHPQRRDKRLEERGPPVHIHERAGMVIHVLIKYLLAAPRVEGLVVGVLLCET